MFDFQKEVIINSNKLEDGVTPRFMALVGKAVNSDGTLSDSLVPKTPIFRVLRCADYVKEGLMNGVIWKTTAVRGSVAEVTFTVPTEKGTYRVFLGLSLDEKYLSDYAMPWYRFSKPVIAEFTLTQGNLSDAQNIMIRALKLAIPENYQFVRISKSLGDVKVSCTDTYQVIKLAKLQKAEDVLCPADSCGEVTYNDYGEQPSIENKKLVPNVMQTGTGEWLQENLRFPSYANLHYKALNSEEYPIVSALYDQYSFQYCVPRRGLHGQGTVGQKLVSVTTHTFYVLNTLSAEFEKAITDAFGADVIVPVNNGSFEVTILNDPTVALASLGTLLTSKMVIQTTVDDGALNTDATAFNYQLIDDTGKYGIVKQEDGSAKVYLLDSKVAANGDTFKVIVNYKGSLATQEFTVSDSKGLVSAYTVNWVIDEDTFDKYVPTSYSSQPSQDYASSKATLPWLVLNYTVEGNLPVTATVQFSKNVTLNKETVTSAASESSTLTYKDPQTLQQTVNSGSVHYLMLEAKEDMGLTGATSVSTNVNGLSQVAV